MLLALSVISPQAAALGATSYKVFDSAGGSIGRIDGNDWVLPDPNNFVSSRHAAVRWAVDGFYLEDTSTNGTFINAPDKAVSRGVPLRLADGDRLYIGDFEIMVQLIDTSPAASAGAAPLELGIVDPLAALGGTTPAPSPQPAPSAPAAAPSGEGARIPDNWDATSFNKQSQAAPPSPAPTPTPPPVASATGGAAELFAALGLDPASVDPSLQRELADIVRVAVQGLMDALKARAEVKNTFHLPLTVMKPVENNPLKFSMNAEDALFNLFVKRNPGYLGPLESFEEGFRDIAFHQAAVLAGVRLAFNAMLAKFHPTHLEEIYDRKLKRTAMLGLGNRSKYWELYRERFEEIDRDREAHFQSLFGEEFARAYDEQLRALAAQARRTRR